MTKELLEMQISGDRLHRLLALIKNYTSTMEISDWNFYKKGIRIYSMDKEVTSTITAAAGKKYFTKYKVTEDFYITMDEAKISDLMNICRLAGEIIMNITITENKQNIRIKYGNVNRRIAITLQDDEPKVQDTTEKVYPKTKVIGELKIEEMKLFMRASATWAGDSERVTKIQKTKKIFEMSTEIVESIDAVILKLDTILKKKIKDEKLNILLRSKSLNNAIKQMDRLTGTITLRGNTDYPLIIMAHDEKPEDLEKFKHDLNFWYLLAPRIESE